MKNVESLEDMSTVELGMGAAQRLLEERTRLGLTQSTLAKIANLSRVSIVKYESGGTLPSSEALIALDRSGIDIRYVLVGIRCTGNRIIRDRFRFAFEEVGRQAQASKEVLTDEIRLELAWRIYDAFDAFEKYKQG
ncbi:helix-turn-helix domain-containing protein [Undibacterium sp. RuTC16W]|uniref:helix-turn-helix domain-containing protein n=1 Tax=Undibacterium sp. RuTC16W TaxID=3413048 RepID=UPI003BF3597E